MRLGNDAQKNSLYFKVRRLLRAEFTVLVFRGSRKAEEDRIRKEEEKARRELIKQEYLRKKQQQILEEQGLGKPKSKPKKPRPKSVHREESYSDSGTKCSSTRKDWVCLLPPSFKSAVTKCV